MLDVLVRLARSRLRPEERSVEETSARSSHRILLTEDIAENQVLALELLEQAGYAVDVAKNGREAVKMSAEGPYDVILMDIQMPEMGGVEATRNIRRREIADGTHTPIIALTAHAMKGDRERYLAAGMDDYVSKPIRRAERLAAVERVCAQPQLR